MPRLEWKAAVLEIAVARTSGCGVGEASMRLCGEGQGSRSNKSQTSNLSEEALVKEFSVDS